MMKPMVSLRWTSKYNYFNYFLHKMVIDTEPFFLLSVAIISRAHYRFVFPIDIAINASINFYGV